MSENKKYEVYATRGTTEFLGHVEAGTREEYIQKAEELLDAYSSEPEAHNCAELGDPNLILEGFGPEEDELIEETRGINYESISDLIDNRYELRFCFSKKGGWRLFLYDFDDDCIEFFDGKTREECEQKLLEWANDEI